MAHMIANIPNQKSGFAKSIFKNRESPLDRYKRQCHGDPDILTKTVSLDLRFRIRP